MIDQTQRRVLQGECVPAGAKLFSVFEPHTDIIIKGSRDIQYGHKLNLSSGKSGLILDVVVEEGNPANPERLVPMLERHISHYGCAPKQLAVDGGVVAGVKARPFAATVFGAEAQQPAGAPWVAPGISGA